MRSTVRETKRTPPLPSERVWGGDSTIGTLSVRHKNGLTETVIYPVLGSALVDGLVVLFCMLGALLLWRSAAVTARRVLHRMRPIAEAVSLPSQPHPVRLSKGCMRVADAMAGGTRRWEVCDLATARHLLGHPAIGSDCLSSLLAPLLPAERRELAFLEASFREWPRFQEGAPKRQLHPTLSRGPHLSTVSVWQLSVCSALCAPPLSGGEHARGYPREYPGLCRRHIKA